jgi:hypothetical protein
MCNIYINIYLIQLNPLLFYSIASCNIYINIYSSSIQHTLFYFETSCNIYINIFVTQHSPLLYFKTWCNIYIINYLIQINSTHFFISKHRFKKSSHSIHTSTSTSTCFALLYSINSCDIYIYVNIYLILQHMGPIFIFFYKS